MSNSLNEARMPNLADKLDTEEQERKELAEKELKAKEKVAKKAKKK